MKITTDKNGFVLCENCSNRASLDLLRSVGWDACGACCFGESSALADYSDHYKREDRKAALEVYAKESAR